MKFRYTQFPGLDDKYIYRPSIPIIFKNDQYFVFTEGIIDSGADYSILPIEIAGKLQIKLDIKLKKTFIGPGNNTFNVYPSPNEITNIIRQSGYRSLEWKSKVFFAESQTIVLLGHHGFLDHFKIIFEGRKKEVEITT